MKHSVGNAYEQRLRRGFILVVLLALVVVIGVLSLAVFTVTRHEWVASGYGERSLRLEMAVEAGLEDALARLGGFAGDDDFIVFESEEEGGGGVTMAAVFDHDEGLWTVMDMRSGDGLDEQLASLAGLEARLPGEVPLVHPYNHAARSADWIVLQPVNPETSSNIEIRYAYVVEDLQGRLDPRWVGNLDGGDGLHALPVFGEAAAVREPVAGRPTRVLDRVGLWAVDDRAAGAQPTADLVDSVLIPERDWLPSLESGLKLAGFSHDALRREPDSRQFIDPTAASWDANLVFGLRPYQERPLVPVISDGVGMDGGSMFQHPGEEKVNLNRVVALAGDDADLAVDLFAGIIERQLPGFAEGRTEGVFPEDYLRTLAAGAIDYADADDLPTVREGVYRGIDVHPLVSEIFYLYHFKSRFVADGHHYMEFEFQVFFELWNMSNQPVEGEARISLDFSTPVMVGGREYVLTDPEMMADEGVVSPVAEVIGGVAYAPPVDVVLEPNGFGIYATPVYTYHLQGPAEGSPFVIPNAFTMPHDSRGNGYRLKWRGVFADACAGRVLRRAMALEEGRRVIRSGVPGLAHGVFPIANMGDPRAAYYIAAPVSANAPGNWSPGRANVRWQLFASDGDEQRMHVRVKPAEWPDGGHDSDFGAYHGQENASSELLPTDPLYQVGAVLPDPAAAPMRHARRGYFLCASELGHVYDPLMYNMSPGDPGDLRALADISSAALPSSNHGGGNTLRIGRPEHPRFVDPQIHAVRLLDLFHSGHVDAEDEAQRTGPTRMIQGHVNINTATKDALRALVAGQLAQDPLMGVVVADASPVARLEIEPLVLSAPSDEIEADVVAAAIMDHRRQYGPFQSVTQLMDVRDPHSGEEVFGNPRMYGQERWHDRNSAGLRWSDSAAEEVFARIYAASTVRSRNFRVTVRVEARSPVTGVVVGKRSRQMHVFMDPGQRDEGGRIVPQRSRPRVTFSRDLF